MKIFVDGALNRCCYVPEGECPTVIDYEGTLTNNESEYQAILAALHYALRNGIERVEILSDSMLAVKQLRGKHRAREPRLAARRDTILGLLQTTGLHAKFTWISRKDNLAGLVLG